MKTITKLSVVLILFLPSCKQTSDINNNSLKTIYVKAAEIIEKEVVFPVRSSGRLGVSSEQKLGFRTGGIIKKIYVENGQIVQEGHLLASLNLSEIEAHVNIAGQAFEKATRDFTRAENLFNDSVATLEQYQNARTALDIARSNLEVARFNLKYSRIEAPTKGKILKILMEENEMTSPGYPVILFGSTKEKWVIRSNISDIDYLALKTGDSAHITLDPYPGIIFRGIISEMAGMADPYTGTYEIETTLLNTQSKRLAIGLIARADLLPEKTEKLLEIPADAVFGSSGKTGYVYKIIADTTVKKVKIAISHISDNRIFGKGDLIQGDMVVSDGINYIDETSIISYAVTE
ncbi:MAG: efflux RND transporter periplasmic adaptor subunit [Bacteroidales bacterium]|nr:efflux RND transporter periplasmic adaptor subunit [Bacteroidales bacterium]